MIKMTEHIRSVSMNNILMNNLNSKILQLKNHFLIQATAINRDCMPTDRILLSLKLKFLIVSESELLYKEINVRIDFEAVEVIGVALQSHQQASI